MRDFNGKSWCMLLMPLGRVGSNLILDILLQSKRFSVFNEPLTAIRTLNADRDDAAIWREQLSWLEKHVASPEAHRLPLVVNISAVSIANFAAFIGFLAAHPPHTLVLDRKSVVETAISAIRAKTFAADTLRESGKARWALREGETTGVKPDVSESELRGRIRVILEGRSRVEAVKNVYPAKTYYYEDFMIDRDGLLADLLCELGTTWFPYRVRYAKFSPQKLADAVQNPDLVSQVAADMGVS